MRSTEERIRATTGQHQPSVEERRALILKVAASEQFSRSARLRDFLLYVGKQSLLDSGAEIHEQEIGAKVFGRPPSYDRSQDNIVRVNATELRKRIDGYFATEGAAEPLIFDIPRGGYRPVFRWRSNEPGRSTPVPPLPSPTPSLTPASVAQSTHAERTLARFRLPVFLALLTVLFAGFCVLLFLQNRALRSAAHPWLDKPAVSAFWGEFLGSNKETEIVLPDSSISLHEEITRQPISLGDYLGHAYTDEAHMADFSPDRKADLAGIFSHNLVTFGDVRAAQQIQSLDPTSSLLRLTTARFCSADSIKRNNLILIGGKKANPWVFLFEDEMNFSLDQRSDSLLMFVTNRKPQTGEKEKYFEISARKETLGYSVVAYLPNPSRTGSVVVLAGTSSDATNAAAEFLTTEEQMDKFRKLLHVQTFPYFEVLLSTSQLSGTSFHAEVVAYRTYPNLR